MEAKSITAARQLNTAAAVESIETAEALAPIGVVRIEDVEDEW